MARHGATRARPAELVPGTVRVITARHELLARASAQPARDVLADSHARVRRALRARPRLPQGAAQPARAARASASRTTSARSVIACSPTARRCSKSRSRRSRASAGAASTRCCSRATWARIFSWARSTPICRCRSRRAVTAHCGTLHRVHRRVPDRRDRRAVRARRAALHLVSDDRAEGQHSRGAAAADRQSRVRLRRLPARVPVESTARVPRPTPISRRAQRSRRRGAIALFAWTEAEFLSNAEGSAIRRIGYERWSRNVAVGAGQCADADPAILSGVAARATIRRRSCASTSRGRSVAQEARSPRRRERSMGSLKADARSAPLANQLIHRHDRQHHGEHQHQHDRAHEDDQRRLDQRRDPGEAPLGVALELAAARSSIGASGPLCSPLATRWISTGGNAFCSLSARDSDTPSRTSAPAARAARAAESSGRRRVAASSERNSGAPLPTRIASVLAKRAVSRLAARRPTPGTRSSAAWTARADAFPLQRHRQRDLRRCDRREPQPPGRAKEVADGDQRLRQQRQRLAALLIHRHDLRHDISDAAPR